MSFGNPQVISSSASQVIPRAPAAPGPPIMPPSPTIILKPSGGDDAANAQAAINLMVGGTIRLQAGLYSWQSTVPQIPRSTPIRIYGDGENATTIQLTVNAPRPFDFNKIADYDTFSDIDITDLTIDCNNVTGSHHTILGTLQNGVFQTRINLLRIHVARVRATNVPTSPTNAFQRRGIALLVAHPADNEATANQIFDISCEDVRVEGGAYGVQVGGTSPGNSANITYDRVNYVRCWHDTTLIPSAAVAGNGANFFIGSGARGGSAGIYACYGANSSDVGIEIDNATRGYVDPNTTIVDAWTTHFFTRNFRAPINLAAQTVEFNGTAINTNLDPVTSGNANTHHFQLGGDNATAAFVFGHLILGDFCSRWDVPMASTSVDGLAVLLNNVQLRKLTVQSLTVGAQSLACNPTANLFPVFVDIRTAYPTSMVDVRAIHFHLAGSRTNNANTIAWRMVRIAGTLRMTVGNITFDTANWVGLTNNDTFNWIIVDGGLGSTLNGTIRGLKALTTPVGGAHTAININSTATLTINGRIIISECDLARLPAGFPDYNIDATQAANVLIQNFVSARAQGSGGPLQTPTGIAVGASPFTYTNNDSVYETVVVTPTGTAVSLNSTPTGQAGGSWMLRPGDTLTVTYAALPTMTKMPAS